MTDELRTDTIEVHSTDLDQLAKAQGVAEVWEGVTAVELDLDRSIRTIVVTYGDGVDFAALTAAVQAVGSPGPLIEATIELATTDPQKVAQVEYAARGWAGVNQATATIGTDASTLTIQHYGYCNLDGLRAILPGFLASL